VEEGISAHGEQREEGRQKKQGGNAGIADPTEIDIFRGEKNPERGDERNAEVFDTVPEQHLFEGGRQEFHRVAPGIQEQAG